MALSEFKLIQQYFNPSFDVNWPASLGISDDCALLNIPSNMQLAVSVDTLVEGVHFLANSNPLLLGHKALAVSLSDLAAMGAKPAWVTLAITLPNSDQAWLSSFSKGFLSLAKHFSMQLIGGDTTHGGLTISVTVMGLLPKGQSLKRSGAQVGDDVYVSGTIGNAGLGLIKAQQGMEDMSDGDLAQYLQPMPKISLGEQILNRATACIDVSDGLSADLNHILTASGVGAVIEHNKLPMTETVKDYIAKYRRQLWPYSSGDDYQLCFTFPKESRYDEDMLRWQQSGAISRIGVIDDAEGLKIAMPDGLSVTHNQGYQHFNTDESDGTAIELIDNNGE